MLKNLEVKNFKSLRDIKLTFSKFNVLIGLNSTGKSSILQSLIFIKQNMGRSKLTYNAGLARFGDFSDLIYNHNTDLSFNIKLLVNLENTDLTYDVTVDKSSVSENISSEGKLISSDTHSEKFKLGTLKGKTVGTPMRIPPEEQVLYKWLEYIVYLPVLRGFTKYNYSMDREISPLIEILRLSGSFSDFENKFSNLLLYHRSKSKKDSSIRKEYQKIAQYLSRLDITLDPSAIAGPSVSPGITEKGLWTSMVNTGFGKNQIFPAIVLGSLVPKGTLILVEEPEIHLHPAMQKEVMNILSDIVNEGKQIIITTHSEHILFNIRRLILENVLSTQDVRVYYLEKKEEMSEKTEITITEDGVFEGGLPGFTDYEIEELNTLIDFLKKKTPVEGGK